MDKKTNKKIGILKILCLAALLLCGCGADTQEEEEADYITLLASQNWIKDIDRELFVKFEEETGIKVEVLLTPDNGYEALAGTCLSGGSSSVDLFMFPTGDILESMGIAEISLDLSEEEWVGRMEDWALKAVSCKGKVIGFNTWGIDYEGILYNKTFFEEQGLIVPDTWDGFLALCDKICLLGAAPLYESINSSWHTRSWLAGLTPLMEQEDPDFREKLNTGMEYRFADFSSFQEGLKQLRQLFAEKENGKSKYYITNGQEDDFAGSYQYLTERKAVMMFTYSAYAAELAQYGSEDKWGMFPVPLLDNRTAVSNGGGIAKFINKNSQKRKESRKLLEFLAQEDNLEAYYAARTDLVNAAFKGMKSTHTTDATKEILARTQKEPSVMFTKDVFYVDPNLYQYFQGFSDGTCSVSQFIRNCDTYREEMFGDENRK